MEIQNERKQQLWREIPIHRAEILALYKELDKKYHLKGAAVPLDFGFDEDLLGSYTLGGQGKTEGFHFSLLFIGYCIKKPLSKEDRRDLYLHEYAHYMQYHMPIPQEYKFEGGIHGSAWKYCCSLVGAAPTPYYRVGEALQKHDYEKALKNPWKVPNAGERFIRKRQIEEENRKNREIRYEIGDLVNHPKFGEGIIEAIEQLEGSVRLRIRFGEEQKAIDQKWLLRAGMKRQG